MVLLCKKCPCVLYSIKSSAVAKITLNIFVYFMQVSLMLRFFMALTAANEHTPILEHLKTTCMECISTDDVQTTTVIRSDDNDHHHHSHHHYHDISDSTNEM